MPKNQRPAEHETFDPAPSLRSLGGVNMGYQANLGRADTGTRIAGQQDMVSQYIDSILGEQQAGFQADSERDQRLAAFRRAQMLMEEQLNSQRLGQQASLSRARSGSAASESAANREHQAEMLAMERAFELGNIAASRDADPLDQRLKELQIAAAEQELGLGDAGPDPRGWGNIVSADRGDALSERKVSSIRDMVINEGQEGGGGIKEFLFDDWRSPFRGSKDPETVDDILRSNRESILGDYRDDPSTIAAQQRIRELLGTDDPVVLSYALRDLGLYAPQA